MDTHSVNLSRASEEVACMFRVKIIPISAGTPQEMAYAESAVRTIGQMSRTMMCGAPHLPQFCWGRADLYATYIHQFAVQAKHGCSPYEFRTGIEPDLDRFFVKVFGAPCQYCPMEGAEHKRGPKTEWGWFLGIQPPMCLVLRPEDNKILSVSKKKIIVHEECYAKFDNANGTNPLAHFVIPTIDLDNTKMDVNNLEKISEYKKKYNIPDHVLSVKALSDFQKHPELNAAIPTTRPPKVMFKDIVDIIPENQGENQRENQGENTSTHVPEHTVFDKDLWLDKVKKLRESINQRYDTDGKVDRIVKMLRKVEEEALNDAPAKGEIKKKASKPKKGIALKNILGNKRRRLFKEDETKVNKDKKAKKKIDVGDRVKIQTKKFGKTYAVGMPTWTYGYVREMKGDLYEVIWNAGDIMKAHKRHLIYQDENENETESQSEPIYNGKTTKETILPILSVGTALSPGNEKETSNWPRDFYEL